MICFIMDVIDNETGESIESICKKVTKAQNNLNIYNNINDKEELYIKI